MMRTSLKNIVFFLIFIVSISNNAAARVDLFNNSNNAFGVTPLMSAVVDEDFSGVVFFSKSKAPFINHKNIGGATALHLASRVGNLEIVKILIENEANVNVVDNENWTPLMRATLANKPMIVSYLLDNGADASKVNNSSQSVIIHAANSSCIKCMEIILEKYDFKNKMNIRTIKRQIDNAYEIARNKDNSDIQTLLRNYSQYLLKTDENNVHEHDLENKNKKYSFSKKEVVDNSQSNIAPVENSKIVENKKAFLLQKTQEQEKSDIVKVTETQQEPAKSFIIKVGKDKSEKSDINKPEISNSEKPKEKQNKFVVIKGEHKKDLKKKDKEDETIVKNKQVKFNILKGQDKQEIPQISEAIAEEKHNDIIKVSKPKFVIKKGQDKSDIVETNEEETIPEIINYKPISNNELNNKRFILFQGENKKKYDIKIDDNVEKIIILDEKEEFITETNIKNDDNEITEEVINNNKTTFRFIKSKEDDNDELKTKTKKSFSFKKLDDEVNESNNNGDIKVKYFLNKKYENDYVLDQENNDNYQDDYDGQYDNDNDYEDEEDLDDYEDFTTKEDYKRYLFIPNR